MKKCSYCGAEYPDDTVVCTLDQTSLDNPSPAISFPWIGFFAWAGLIIGIFGTTYVVWISFPFYFFHNQELGHGVMIWMAFVLVAGFWSALLGLPCSIIGIIKGRRLIGWLGVFFVLLPAPLGWAILKTAMVFNGLQLED